VAVGVISWWWLFLCGIGAVNVAAWSLAARALKRRRPGMAVESYAAARIQSALSAVYVVGCAFRCALPVYDIPRFCLFDMWLSSVIVGRSVATVAELCFAAQWALMLHETAHATGSVVTGIVSRTLVPLIIHAPTPGSHSADDERKRLLPKLG
jgi:hypothetical protein